MNHYVKTAPDRRRLENIVSLNLVKKEGEYFEEDSKDSLQALVKKEGDSSGREILWCGHDGRILLASGG